MSSPHKLRSSWKRRTALAGTIVAIGSLVGGCGDWPPDSDWPTTSRPAGHSSNPTVLPRGGAPKVSQPLPRSVLDGDPCRAALPQAELGRYWRVPTGAPKEDITSTRTDAPYLGPMCTWDQHSTGGRVTVTYVLDTHTGLSAVYENVQMNAKTWQELPAMRGLPAVAYAVDAQTCHVAVGLADDLSIDVTANPGRNTSPQIGFCDPARQVADSVVSTLAPGRK